MKRGSTTFLCCPFFPFLSRHLLFVILTALRSVCAFLFSGRRALDTQARLARACLGVPMLANSGGVQGESPGCTDSGACPDAGCDSACDRWHQKVQTR